MRLVLAVLLLIGCGGGDHEGGDCSYWVSKPGYDVAETCSAGVKLTCCSSSSTHCNGLTPNVWHQVPGGC